jgi:TolB-like protein
MSREKRILRSWKEISSYLHRTPRTCQRWQKEFGLPIRREDNAPFTSVYAYEDELAAWLSRKYHEPDIGEGDHSIAVLPFIDLSSTKTQNHFSAGMAAALIELLSGFQNLRVCALTSALSLAGEKLGIQEIGHRLIVGSVLEGCLQIKARTIELSASLASTRDGYTLWAQRYAGHMDNLADIEEDIVGNIVKALRLRSKSKRQAALERGRLRYSEAGRLCIRGRYFFNKMREKELNKSIAIFRKALEFDESLTAGYAGLADSYVHIATLGYRPPKEVLPKARMAALKALSLNGSLPEGFVALAMTEWILDYRPSEAEKHFRRSLELNPNRAGTREFYGNFLISLGRWDEGMAELEAALDLDPLSLIINCSLAYGFYLASDYARAMSQCSHCLGLEEKSAWIRNLTGRICLAQGLFEAARKEFQTAIALSKSSSHFLARLACTDALAGNTEGASQILRQILGIAKKRYVDSVDIAEIYVALMEYEKAMRWLERAFKQKAMNLVWIKCNPLLAKLKLEPRFQALTRKIGLEK